MPTNGDLSLYIHVPFCTKKCHYCHFFVIPNNESHQTDWFVSLKKEWELIQPLLQGYQIVTLYFGGGTPSLLPPEWVAEIIEWVKKKNLPLEITLEINPDDASLEKLQQFFRAGINRLSIGIQTFDDEKLLTLGRLHKSDKATRSVEEAYQAGFRNISCDLMYDLPNQTLADWNRNLDKIIQLPITHLSLYNLTIEPNTAFYKHRKRIQPLLPEDNLSKEMFLLAVSKLTAAGFDQYEISAFSRNNLFSQHNIGYWLGRPFLGLGPSAFSYYRGKRFQNAPSMSQYKNSLKAGKLPITFEEELDEAAKVRELFAIQLRLSRGVCLAIFEDLFGSISVEMRKTLAHFEELGWIENAQNQPRLTQEGILFYDSIAEGLI